MPRINDPTDFVPNRHENTVEGENTEQRKAKRTDGTKINTNYDTILKAFGSGYYKGNECIEGNTHGGMPADDMCHITLASAEGTSSVALAGTVAFIRDGDGKHFYAAIAYDDELDFGPDNITSGVKATGFSNSTWIDGLEIIIMPFLPVFPKPAICLDGATGLSVLGEDVFATADKLTKIDEEFDSLHEQTDTALGADGSLNPNVIPSDALNNESFSEQQSSNLVPGSFELFDRGTYFKAGINNIARGWAATGTPPTEAGPNTVNVLHGTYSQYWKASAIGVGIVATVEDFEKFKGQEIAAGGYIYTSAGVGSAKIGIYDGKTWQWETDPLQPSGSFQFHSKIATIASDATTLEIHLVSNVVGATDFYADCVMVNPGDTNMGFTPSEDEMAINIAKSTCVLNVLLNTSMKNWSRGTNQLPDFVIAGAIPPTTIEQSFTQIPPGGVCSAKIKLANAQSFYFPIYIPARFSGGDSVVGIYLQNYGAGTDKLKIKITKVDGTTVLASLDNIPVHEFTDWELVQLHLPPQLEDDLAARIYVENIDGTASNAEFNIGLPQYGAGKYASKFKLPCAWSEDCFIDFLCSGATGADAYMKLDGVLTHATGLLPTLPFGAIIARMEAFATTVSSSPVGACKVLLNRDNVTITGYDITMLASGVIYKNYVPETGSCTIVDSDGDSKVMAYWDQFVAQTCTDVKVRVYFAVWNN